MALFRIKICGITRSEDAQAAADFGADAIGLNFYPGSRRFLNDYQASTLCRVLLSGVARSA